MTRQVVWKYEIETTGYMERDLPRGARIVAVDVQRGKPCFWALVNPAAEVERRRFYLLGTGQEIWDDDDVRYVGTFMLTTNGVFVGHLFEIAAAGEAQDEIRSATGA